DDPNCPNFGRRHCEKTTHTCVACIDHGDCGFGTPYCSPTHTCVECLAPANCPQNGETCDPVTNRCSRECDSSNDCSSNQVNRQCDPDRKVCVQCLGDGNCGGGE